MRNTITIGDKNTFDDWHLFMATTPIVNPPQPRFNYVDILGMSGSLDFTEALTKFPRYSDREGSWEFTVLNPGDVEEYTIKMEGSYKYDWNDLYSDILTYLHGKRFEKIVLSDDPYHTYRGRVWVNEAQSNSTWGRIVLNYRLEPYKYSLDSITKNVVEFPSGAIETSVRKELSLKRGTYPSPLHFYIEAPNFEPETLRAVSVRFANSELEINTTRRFTGTMMYDPITDSTYPADFGREIIVPQMLVSNQSDDEEHVCVLIIGHLDEDHSDYGPIKVEYWWEEASL